jgi:hypothetical protein
MVHSSLAYAISKLLSKASGVFDDMRKDRGPASSQASESSRRRRRQTRRTLPEAVFSSQADLLMQLAIVMSSPRS